MSMFLCFYVSVWVQQGGHVFIIQTSPGQRESVGVVVSQSPETDTADRRHLAAGIWHLDISTHGFWQLGSDLSGTLAPQPTSLKFKRGY